MKYYRLFISSTFQELEGERKEILSYIASRRDIPIGMENFSADNNPPEATIRFEIQNCDAVILGVGANAGSESREYEGRLYVEKEIDWAIEFNKPIFAYVPEVEYEGSRRIIDYYNSKRPGLMRKYNKSQGLVDRIKSDYDNVIKKLNKMPHTGLVEARYYEDFESLIGLNNDLLHIDLLCKAVEDLSRPRKLIGRMRKHNTELFNFVGFTLWRTLGSMLFHKENKSLKLYYDGGASVLYAGSALVDYLNRHNVTSHRPGGNIDIDAFTNCALTHLTLLFYAKRYNHRVNACNIVPSYGYYSDYGVCLGDIMDSAPDTTDAFWERSEFKSLETDIYSVREEIEGCLEGDSGSVGVIVSSISGYSVDENPCKTGPWVRSLPNYLFRLMLIRLEIPIIFLLDENKWKRKMIQDRSINILPEEYLKKESDLPICYVFSTYDFDKYNEFIAYFEKIGFSGVKKIVDPEIKSIDVFSSKIIYGVSVYTSSFAQKCSAKNAGESFLT